MIESTLSSRELSTPEGSRSVKSGSLIEPANAVPRRMPRRIPFSVPRDQLYYWSREWQNSIRESMAEIEAGEYVIFDDPDDPEDVVRWLLSDED